MKQTTKKFGLLLILAFTTFFSSCEKDLYEEALQKEEKRIEIKKVSLNDIPQIIDELEEVKKQKVKSNGFYNRTIEDFVLNENTILVAEKENYTSYTFEVIKKFVENEPFYVENLIIESYFDTTRAYVTKYIPEDGKIFYSMSKFSGIIKSETLEGEEKSVVNVDIKQFPPITNDHIAISIGCWDYVFANYGDGYFIFSATNNCGGNGDNNGSDGGDSNNDSGSSDNSNDIPGNNSSNNSGNNGGVSSSSSSSSIYDNSVTVPNYLSLEQQFIDSLDSQQEYFNNLNSTVIENIFSYLDLIEDNGHGPNQTTKKIKVRNALMQINLSWISQKSVAMQSSVFNYLIQNNFNPENVSFMVHAVNQMVLNPGVFPSIKPFLIEKNIDDTALPPCSKNILSVIKNLSHNDFAKIITRLGSTDSIYSVFINPIQNFNLNTGNLAETSIADVNNLYSYNISIDSQYLTQGTKLSIASTILHELIHAYFYSLIADEYNTGNSTLNTFPELWDYYVVNMSNMTPGGSPQHLVMAQNYVNVLGEALQEFDTGVPVTSSNPLQQKYKDLAWGGLYGTIPYNSLSQSEKDRITAVNIAEETNSSQIENGTTHLPISTPCN